MSNIYIKNRGELCSPAVFAECMKNIGNEKESVVFAKKCICDFLGMEERTSSVSFAYNMYGKPIIKDIYDKNGIIADTKVNFSLSHSDNIIICAVTYFNIGIDCQKKNIHDADRCKKIAKRFYSVEENIFLDAQKSDVLYIDNFFEIWTKKEAYIKYTGKGFAEKLQSFSVADSKYGQKEYYQDVVFKKITTENIKAENFVIYLCHSKYIKDKQNTWEIKYF